MTTCELAAVGRRTLVIKRADPADRADEARLAHEATMLAMARHPGVVEVDPHPDAPDPADAVGPRPTALELRTVYAGSRTLAAADLDPLAALRALVVAAGTLADLHAVGLVHGRLDPDHIVLTGTGRAVLCGFAEAGLSGDRRSDGEVLTPSTDVAALGARLAEVLALAPEPIRATRHDTVDRVGLAPLIARATADPGLRPSARAFAATLAAALPRPPRPGLIGRLPGAPVLVVPATPDPSTPA